MYFASNYICFFAFGFTTGLSITQALFIFVMGSLGMIAPVQGGIGPWHFMTISALVLYGIQNTEAATFALIVHGSMSFIMILGGVISLILLPLLNKNNVKQQMG